MRSGIRRLVAATNVIDRAYYLKSRSMAVKANIVVLLYALADDGELSQSKLHNDWLLPLSTINTIVTECRNAGYITLEPIPGCRRECRLRFTPRGRAFADLVLGEIHAAEERAMVRNPPETFSVVCAPDRAGECRPAGGAPPVPELGQPPALRSSAA